MTSSAMTMPTPAAARLRVPAGDRALAGDALSLPFPAVYIKGTTVFADRPAVTTARPNARLVLGARSWSPPV